MKNEMKNIYPFTDGSLLGAGIKYRDISDQDLLPAYHFQAAIPVTESGTSLGHFQTEDPMTALKADIQAKGCGTELQAYYDIRKKEYLIRNAYRWITHVETQFKRRLKKAGISTKSMDENSLSPADHEILRIQDHESVQYAGPLAGYKEGLHEEGCMRFLVTESPLLIEPCRGDWDVLRKVFEAVLSDPEHDQLSVFYGWLQVAVKALRQEQLMPGQALVMAGVKGCGKSLIQNLITQILGGRSAKPYWHMTGSTKFNSDLFRAEHLMIEDEAPSTDFRSRRNLGSFIKQLTVNEEQRLHAKNKDIVMMKPFWRVSITLNDEPEDLHVLPPIDSSLEDKLILFRAYKRDLPMQSCSAAERRLFWDALKASLPAFLDWLLTEFEVPEKLRADRFGVTHFHHPELLAMLREISNEARLMALIDQYIPLPFEGSAAELEKQLYEKAPRQQATRLLYFTNAAGAFLGRIKNQPDSRVSRLRTAAGNLWRIETGIKPAEHSEPRILIRNQNT
jgi:hypothetical protein